MELSVVSNEGKTISASGESEIKKMFEEEPFLHRVFERLGRVIAFCSVSKRFFVMDEEAFNAFGEKFLAKNRMLPFFDYGNSFYFFSPVITTKCNLACSYCYGSEGKRKGKSSNWEILKNSIDFIARQGKPVHISFFSSGEQLIDYKLFEKTLAYIRKKLKISSIKMSTNGTHNPDLYLRFMNYFDSFQVSLDGPPEIQDKQRPLEGGGRSSPLVEKTIKKLVEENKKFLVKVTITKLHKGREEHTFKYFHDLGVERLAFSIVVPLGCGKDWRNSKEEELNSLIESQIKIKELCDSFGLDSKTSTELVFGHNYISYCGAGHIFNVGVDGLVASCEIYGDSFDLKANKRMQDLLIGKYDFEKKCFEIDEKKVKELRNAHKKAKCYDCDLKLCWGGCPLRNPKKDGSIARMDSDSCRQKKAEFSAIMEYLAKENVIRIKPCLEKKNGKLYYSMQFSEFELSRSNGKKLSGNPFIEFLPEKENLDLLFEKITAHSCKNRKKITLFLLSPRTKARLDPLSSVRFKDFLYSLKKNRVLFKITRPVKITDVSAEAEENFYKEFSIPKNCRECLELFTVREDGRVEYCNGIKGKKTSEVFDRNEIYSAFKGKPCWQQCQ